jgi:hypothetical protein
MSKLFLSDDTIEFLYLLNKYKVSYVIVGGEAVIYYGHARLTGDIDIFYDRTDVNSKNLFNALNEFWNNNIPGISDYKELLGKGAVFQFGIPPNRIDLINVIEGVSFKEVWKNKTKDNASFKRMEFGVFYIGLNELIKNKKAVGRFKDKEDLQYLNELKKKNK